MTKGYDSRKIIALRGGLCEMFDCDLSAEHVHHKDHNRENNDESNLVVLCRSCHAFVHRCYTFDEYHDLMSPVKRRKEDLDNILNNKYEWSISVMIDSDIPREFIYDLFSDMGVELV